MNPDVPNGGGPEVHDLPGGARSALEAVLMVLDQPATEEELAAGLELDVPAVRALLEELQREYNGYTVQAPDMEKASSWFRFQPPGF